MKWNVGVSWRMPADRRLQRSGWCILFFLGDGLDCSAMRHNINYEEWERTCITARSKQRTRRRCDVRQHEHLFGCWQRNRGESAHRTLLLTFYMCESTRSSLADPVNLPHSPLHPTFSQRCALLFSVWGGCKLVFSFNLITRVSHRTEESFWRTYILYTVVDNE